MKCREYKAYSVLCQQCDLKTNIPCSKEFNYDKPTKYINVKRNDMMSCSWNECPTCGNSIGYYPKDKEFRCSKCNQRILWED